MMLRTAQVVLRRIMLLVALVLVPAVAEACRCAISPPQQQVRLADVIFEGTVVAVERHPHEPRLTVNPTFAVERTWKGEPVEWLQVYTGGCGPRVNLGERHVIFAERVPGRLVADGCAHGNYEDGVRGRGAYDLLLPGHETVDERRLRLERAAELEALYGRARAMIGAGDAAKARDLLWEAWEYVYYDEEGRRLHREAEAVLARGREAAKAGSAK